MSKSVLLISFSAYFYNLLSILFPITIKRTPWQYRRELKASHDVQAQMYASPSDFDFFSAIELSRCHELPEA